MSGGRKPPDHKPKPPGGPGKGSRRTDMMGTKPQPVRAPTGMPYGDNQALSQAQQAIPLPNNSALPTGGQGAPQPVSGPSTPPAGMSMADLVGNAPTQNPDQPMMSSPTAKPTPQVLSAQQLADALETVVQSGPVSKSLMDLYMEARSQARAPVRDMRTSLIGKGPQPGQALL